jgi:LemA protein
MSNQIIFVLILLAIVVFWTVGAYNRLVRLRNAIATAFTQVDVQLGQRHEAVRRLSALVGAEAGPPVDRGMLEAACQQAGAALELARRHPGDARPITSLALAEQVLDESLERMPAGPHPDSLLAGLDELASLTSQVGFARQQFNAAVLAYNQAVQQAPTHLLSRVFGFGLTAELPDAPAAAALRGSAP